MGKNSLRNILDEIQEQEGDGLFSKQKSYNREDEFQKTKRNVPQERKYPYSNQSDSRTSNTDGRRVTDVRTGMSEKGWKTVFKITEVILDIIKGGMMIGGILMANLADTIMGAIAMSFMIKPEIQQYTQYAWLNPMTFGVMISLGAASVQIYMWSLIQKRRISFKTILNPKMWKTIPREIHGFLVVALILWAIDTFMDISPMFVFYTDAVYGQTGLYPYLVGAGTFIVVMLCGFAEILTSNMRSMFGESFS